MGTIRGTRIVAQIQIIVLGQHPADLPEYGQPAVTGIEHTDGARLPRQRQLHFSVHHDLGSLIRLST